jgi:hypothetical protein
MGHHYKYQCGHGTRHLDELDSVHSCSEELEPCRAWDVLESQDLFELFNRSCWYVYCLLFVRLIRRPMVLICPAVDSIFWSNGNGSLNNAMAAHLDIANEAQREDWSSCGYEYGNFVSILLSRAPFITYC